MRGSDRGYRGRLSAAARTGVVIAAFSLGALFALGSLVAVMFEADGFGRRDGGPRWWYIASLAVGLAASVGIPFLFLRWLLPAHSRRAPLYLGIAMALAFVLFGLAVKP